MRTTIFVKLFPSIFKENQRKCRISLKISSKIVPGFFIMVFYYIFIVNFNFLGPAVVPPTNGVENWIFSKNLRLGSNCCINRVNFSHFPARPREGDGPAPKSKQSKGKHGKA